jgi:hypothetical protein
MYNIIVFIYEFVTVAETVPSLLLVFRKINNITRSNF